MKNIYYLILGLTIFLSACNNKADDLTDRMKSIPKLINRPEGLQNGKEWDKVQSQYAKERDALIKNPKDCKAWVELSELFIQEARSTGEHHYYYKAVLVMSDRVIDLNPTEADLMFRCLAAKSSVQLSLHDFAGALETATKASKLNPYNAQIFGALVDANVELGNYPDAVAAADKMMSIRPDLRSYSRVSYLREIHGDIKGSIEAMQMAVQAGYPGQESTAWAALTLGKLYQKYDKPENAEVIYNQILEERPEYPNAQAALAEIKTQQGKYSEAKQLINKALNNIQDVSFYIQLAEIAKKEGNKIEFEKSSKELLTLLEADVKSGHHMDLEYAKVYTDLMDNPAKGLEYAKKEYERRPNNIDVNRELARICSKLGQDSDAKKYYLVASKTNSKYPELNTIKTKLNI